ncbi:hypothetical protein GCM10022415_34020 [Knoellia locipacati]|uniref:Uncharacterized protein n=1 Tax=Knoellia locipacati TaxID=882824 RepID=A0A512T542_9MICO|nr:hypothetical protein KLO01_33950 [Knoellia locipacati]
MRPCDPRRKPLRVTSACRAAAVRRERFRTGVSRRLRGGKTDPKCPNQPQDVA